MVAYPNFQVLEHIRVRARFLDHTTCELKFRKKGTFKKKEIEFRRDLP